MIKFYLVIITRRCIHGSHRAPYGPVRLIIRIFPSLYMASTRARTVPTYTIVWVLPSPYEIHRDPYGVRTLSLRNPLGYAYGMLRSRGLRACRGSIERPYVCNHIARGWFHSDFERFTFKKSYGPGTTRRPHVTQALVRLANVIHYFLLNFSVLFCGELWHPLCKSAREREREQICTRVQINLHHFGIGRWCKFARGSKFAPGCIFFKHRSHVQNTPR